jgi:hypothetical protein
MEVSSIRGLLIVSYELRTIAGSPDINETQRKALYLAIP